ncbi:MAG: transposon-encoded TnpW family protein [Lachnospiraceae bacterium]|nr:transposon-encoded TnpW family protein [Lachnospiraceae bacterium]
MTETKNEQLTPSFKRKLGNTTNTVKVHFSEDTNKTFKNRVQKLIINECHEKDRNSPHHHFTNLIRGQFIIRYGTCRTRGYWGIRKNKFLNYLRIDNLGGFLWQGSFWCVGNYAVVKVFALKR